MPGRTSAQIATAAVKKITTVVTGRLALGIPITRNASTATTRATM